MKKRDIKRLIDQTSLISIFNGVRNKIRWIMKTDKERMVVRRNRCKKCNKKSEGQYYSTKTLRLTLWLCNKCYIEIQDVIYETVIK